MKAFEVNYEYIENNGQGKYIESRYVQAPTINEALTKAQSNVPENQRITGIHETGEAIL